jgi:hypothetical protein
VKQRRRLALERRDLGHPFPALHLIAQIELRAESEAGALIDQAETIRLQLDDESFEVHGVERFRREKQGRCGRASGTLSYPKAPAAE